MTTSLLGYVETEERRTPDKVSIEREVDVIEAVIQRTNSVVHLVLVGHSYVAPCVWRPPSVTRPESQA